MPNKVNGLLRQSMALMEKARAEHARLLHESSVLAIQAHIQACKEFMCALDTGIDAVIAPAYSLLDATIGIQQDRLNLAGYAVREWAICPSHSANRISAKDVIDFNEAKLVELSSNSP